ncbi:hypothetical protein [Methanolobus psychrotolerans]|uniref:hypothetical protein n=1 Tax=Methanolobus psychrotolerans TaxID=1874706 RepID=UPI000B91C07E|nr:hypothetical protein [Methanolobus psychrotolerans]
MCIIEELGYSEKNKEHYCLNCIIFLKTGKCEYLNYLEAKFTVNLYSDYFQEIMIDECGY